MKTAEEWIKLSGDKFPRQIANTNCSCDEACVCNRCKEGIEFFLLPEDIKQIQLDAMKEGARRAANITVCVNKYCHLPMANEICMDRHAAILTTAEQWTEKDL